MLQYTNVVKGSVYELLDRNNQTNQKLYVVVSDSLFHIATNNALICLIAEHQDNEQALTYHVPFTMITGKQSEVVDIMPELIMSVDRKRLVKYKFTLNESIMADVDKVLFKILTSKTLYTLDEAIVKLHNDKVEKEINASINNRCVIVPEKEEKNNICDINFDDLSLEDSQLMFAKYYKDDIPIEDTQPKKEEVVTDSKNIGHSNTNNNSVTKKKKDSKSTIKVKGKKKQPKEKSNLYHRFDHIYERYEEYLLDYYTTPKQDMQTVADKWKIRLKDCGNRAYQCKLIYLRNHNNDFSQFEEFESLKKELGYKSSGEKLKKIKK